MAIDKNSEYLVSFRDIDRSIQDLLSTGKSYLYHRSRVFSKTRRLGAIMSSRLNSEHHQIKFTSAIVTESGIRCLLFEIHDL